MDNMGRDKIGMFPAPRAAGRNAEYFRTTVLNMVFCGILKNRHPASGILPEETSMTDAVIVSTARTG
ncbi:MAG: hypothetical protein ACO1N5_03375, partial [Noviherbaspirillum sp.]